MRKRPAGFSAVEAALVRIEEKLDVLIEALGGDERSDGPGKSLDDACAGLGQEQGDHDSRGLE